MVNNKNKQKESVNGLAGTLIGLVAGALISGVVCYNIAISKYEGNEPIAKVGDTEILSSDLFSTMKDLYGVATTENLINDEIVRQEAEKAKIEVSEDEIQTELESMAVDYGGLELLEAQITAQGQKMESLKDDIKSYLQLKKLLASEVEITDEEIETYFEEHKAELGQQEQVNASHILVDDEATANKVLAELDEGGDFAELAKKYSTDTATAEAGGELGYFGRNEMVPEFEEAAFSTPVGEVSKTPIKSDFGYHIIKVIDKVEAKEAVLKDVKDKVVSTLMDEKVNSEYQSWFEDMLEKYEVVNYLVTSKNTAE